MSNITPANAKADKPPLQIVPGHNAGEKRKAQLAVKRLPNPRPAFTGLRRDAGWAKRFAAVAVAIERMLKTTDVGTSDGGWPSKIDAPMVTRKRMPPETRVRFISPVEHVKDEAFQLKACAVAVDFAVLFEFGRGGLR